VTGVAEERRRYSEERLRDLRDGVAQLADLGGNTNLCIYATGSYGRREANEFSDLDLFFIHTGTAETPLHKTSKALLDADLIRLGRKLGFPEFSGYGEYLEIHYLEEVRRTLGSREDDWRNYFTGRLLLLLESVPVHNDALYEKMLSEIIDMYYRDYHDHVDAFRPLFLVNDIIRFWKTLCLNYEHGRGRPTDDDAKRNANHLKNLKLKFSRLLTCYSTLIALTAQERVSPEAVLALVHEPPLRRLEDAAAKIGEGEKLLQPIQGEYAWFLQAMARPKSELLEWISEKSTRDEAFTHARAFGRGIYDLLVKVPRDEQTLRYLVV
jgi:hypothetical protein